jgi:mannose-6-phosphate isomerase
VPARNHLSSPNLGGADRFASEPQKVEKPWGHELIFAVTERYAGKLLFVRAGESLSLQFHNVKDESWYVLDGRAPRAVGAPGERMLVREVVGRGASFHLAPGTVHRVQALEDTTILEVSTPELDDVVRLEDRYGRAGEREL